jgi:alkylation response protein AidB-like acyl-CoA dehydrogenase
MATASAQRLHALAWTSERPAHVARAALFASASQAEAGVGCPISMTYAAVPALRQAPEVSEAWERLLTAPAYDPELRPWAQKTSARCGMAMTEKRGGSDVRATTTWHAAHRSAFGRRLIEQPPMTNVLADLCLESEAATALAMFVADAFCAARLAGRRGPGLRDAATRDRHGGDRARHLPVGRA